MKNKIIYRVFAIIFPVFLLLGIVLVAGSKYCEIEGIYEKVDYSQYIAQLVSCEKEDDKYIVSGGDPQLIIDLSKYKNGKIYGINISFKEEVKPYNVTMYYAGSDYIFSEFDSESFNGAKRTEYSFLIPEEFAVLRLDVNEDFAISDIEVAYDYKVISHGLEYGYLIVLVLSLVFAIALSWNTVIARRIEKAIDGIIEYIKNKYVSIKELIKNAGRRKTIICLMIPLLIVIFSMVAEKGMAYIGITSAFNKLRCILIIAAMLVIYVTVLFRKIIFEKAHIYFWCVVMIIGVANIWISPPAVGLAHDDEIHYERTAYVSWGCIGKVTYADSRVKDRYKQVITTKDVYTSSIRHQWATDINNMAESVEEGILLVDCKTSSFNLQYVPYIPAAAGMVVARAVGLSFTHQFMLGKLINLICYATIMALAIKCLSKRGKLIAMGIGLIPTSVYMASSYSYDWWVIGLCALAYAMLISKIQKNEKMSTGYFSAIVSIIVLALLPKAIYFTMIIPLFFFKSERYNKSKLARGIAIAGIVFLIMTFLIPMLQSSDGITDLRGGSDVNSIEQMKHILSHPITYAGVLIEFLCEYLSLDNASSYLTMLGYHGIAKYFTICILIICIFAIIDNNKKDNISKINKEYKDNIIYKLIVYTSMFATVVLVATSLYVMFTPVAASTINGCQYRYLLPMVFPTVYYLSDLNIEVSADTKRKCMAVGTIGMTLVFLYGIYSLCGALYIC